MSEGFVALLALSEADAERAQLEQSRHRLPAKVEGDALKADAQGLLAAKRMLDDERGPLAEALASIEAEVTGLRVRREQTLAHLSTAVGAGRELEAMDAEVQHLTSTIDTLETSELELLEQISPLDDRLASLEADLSELRERHQELEKAFGEQSRVVDEALSALARRRSDILPQIEPGLLDRYERIAARTASSGAALLSAGHCGGCHIELASGEIDALRHLPLEDLGSCEQCGRLLLRPEQVS